MRLSISLTNYSWRDRPLVDGLLRAAEAADAGGLDTIWVPDHLVQVDPTVVAEADDMLEAYSVLSYLAGRTERVRLGTMVTNVALRPPALLANTVATLDTLSGGRAWLGVGAGYDTSEVPDLGLPTPPSGQRFELLEETLRVVTQMFSGDTSPITGRHAVLERPFLQPRPRHGIPLLIGGSGERRTLRLVAEFADACNLPDLPDGGATVRHKLEVLAEHCRAVGRPREAIEATLSTRLAPDETTADLVERCQRVTGWGIEHVIFVSSTPWAKADLDVIVGAAGEVAEFRARLVAVQYTNAPEPPARAPDQGE
jgi:alkanesulfonate monooxygenase SsuD/methylene tetrahydromethanopterin reductase-like flavin-dependent oxidoreductase (luciferase family)